MSYGRLRKHWTHKTKRNFAQNTQQKPKPNLKTEMDPTQIRKWHSTSVTDSPQNIAVSPQITAANPPQIIGPQMEEYKSPIRASPNWNSYAPKATDSNWTPRQGKPPEWQHLSKQAATTTVTTRNSPKKAHVWTSKSPDTFVDMLKKRTVSSKNLGDIGYIEDYDKCLFKPIHKDLAEKCNRLLREYRRLCKKQRVKPNKRILTSIFMDKYAEDESIKFRLSGIDMKREEKITDLEIIPLFAAINVAGCKSLVTELDLSGNRLRDHGLEHVAGFLWNNIYIRRVNFKFNNVSKPCAMRIANALATTFVTHRSEIVIGNANLNLVSSVGKTMNMLGEFFAQSRRVKIERSHFEGNLQWIENMTLSCEGMTIKELKIENVKMNSVSEELYSILTTMLTCNIKNKNRIIQKLHVTFVGNSLNVDPTEWIGRRLRSNHLIKELDLSNFQMNHQGLKMLAPALGKRKFGGNIPRNSLVRLSLAGNAFGNVGARYICKILEWNASLQYLDLRWCGLKDEGLCLIGNVAAQMKHTYDLHLKELLLFGNRFGRESTIIWKRILDTRFGENMKHDLWEALKVKA